MIEVEVAEEETVEVVASIVGMTEEAVSVSMTEIMTAEVSVPAEDLVIMVALAIVIVTATDAIVVGNEIAIGIGIAGQLNVKDAVDGVVTQTREMNRKMSDIRKRFKI